jgi:hypothetical protein
MTRLFLHLGYPKTGTTTLQRSFFDPLHRQGLIHYLGMFGFARDANDDRRTFFSHLTASLYLERDEEFGAVLPGLQARFHGLCQGLDLPVVLSNEHFVQSQWSTTVPGQRIMPARTAHRLAQVFEDAEVTLMLAVRRQDALLRSMFLEHASRPNHANPEEYSSLDRYVDSSLDPTNFHAAFLDFSGVMANYRDAFPDASVLAWSYEAFRDRQQDVLVRLTRKLGIGESVPEGIDVPLSRLNAKSNGGGAATLRRWSPVHRILHAIPGGDRLAREAGRLPVARALSDALKPRFSVPTLTQGQAARIMRHCAPSNEGLAVRFPDLASDLERHGYLHRMEAVA